MNYKEQLELWPDYRPNVTVTKPLQAAPEILTGIYPRGYDYLRQIPGPQVKLTPAQHFGINTVYKELLDKQAKLDNEVKAGTKTWPDVTTSKEAVRHNQGKTRWDLIDFESLKPIADVLEYGANTKYAAWNFQTGKGLSVTQTIRSMLSHTFAYLRGEELDPESELPHIGHIGANLLFLLYFYHYKFKDNDDRFKR